MLYPCFAVKQPLCCARLGHMLRILHPHHLRALLNKIEHHDQHIDHAASLKEDMYKTIKRGQAHNAAGTTAFTFYPKEYVNHP